MLLCEKFPETEKTRDAATLIQLREKRELEIVARGKLQRGEPPLKRIENLTLDVLQGIGEPVETLVQTLAVGGAGGLDVPVPVPHILQAQLLRQLGRLQRVGKILWSICQ